LCCGWPVLEAPWKEKESRETISYVSFPISHLVRIHYLIKLSFAEAFRTEEDPNDVVAEVCHAALQRQQAQLLKLKARVRSGRMTSRGMLMPPPRVTRITLLQ
jgi:hypothetical protein